MEEKSLKDLAVAGCMFFCCLLIITVICLDVERNNRKEAQSDLIKCISDKEEIQNSSNLDICELYENAESVTYDVVNKRYLIDNYPSYISEETIINSCKN